MSGVRDAAVALIAAASEAAVIAALRLLLEDIAPVSAPRLTPKAPSPVMPRPTPVPRDKPATATQPATDAAWEAMRLQVKAAMAERDASYADVAAAISRSEIAVRIGIGSRRPPKPIVLRRLQEWLEQAAPAVAAAPVPFPGSSTEHRGNGHADGPYGHASAG